MPISNCENLNLLVSEKHRTMTKRRHDGPELENGGRRKKSKTRDKDDENLAVPTSQTVNGNPVLADELDIIHANRASKQKKKSRTTKQESVLVDIKKPVEGNGGPLPAVSGGVKNNPVKNFPPNLSTSQLGEQLSRKLEKPKGSKERRERRERHKGRNQDELEQEAGPVALQKATDEPVGAADDPEQEAGPVPLQKAAHKPLGAADDHVLSRKYRKEAKKDHGKFKNCAWTLSDVGGGQMLGLDPVFSLNEDYLLVPHDTAIHVYAISTSLLVRRLRMSGSQLVSAFAITPTNPKNLFVSTNLGSIEKWDWIEGRRLEYWHISASIYSLATSHPDTDQTANGLVYTVDRKGQAQWMLTVHRLLGGSDASKTDLGTLLKHSEPLTSVKILDSGRTILVTSGHRIMIGSCDRPSPSSLKDVSYIWRHVDCPEWIASIDVRMRSDEAAAKKPQIPTSPFHRSVDVAAGTLKGRIIIYDDLLGNLLRVERGGKTGQVGGISSRFLNWHRTAVLSLKWSADGNYIISGGLETVLVLWQLETGQKQVLPHLSAPIESIVVSPSGSSYGVRLADNSAMILSTSELKPTFSVAGIQLPAKRETRIPLKFVPTVNVPSQNSISKTNLSFPAVVSPSNPGHLLLAVPSFTTSGLIPESYNPCYLQTFDIGSSHQLSKQALTRTKDTILNIGPELNPIEEPSVIHLQISHDSQWLATIDEWLPPKRDLAMLAFDTEREVDEQLRRREVYMKIWEWEDKSKTWVLSSRVDNPHSSNLSTVLDLASDPSCASFATIGDDYSLRIWKPSVRYRNGREVCGPDGKRLMTWRCRFVTPLEDCSVVGKENLQGAKLAYSPDGSILAAGYSLSSPSTIYLIEASTGNVTRTLSSLYTGPLIGLGILEKFLIILSNDLRVWDLVAGEDSFAFHLNSYGWTVQKRLTATHLAIDSRQRTFAISLLENRNTRLSRVDTKLKSRILVFDPNWPSPLFESAARNPTKILLPAKGQNNYYIVDDAAEVWELSPSQSVPLHFRQPSVERAASPWGLENIYGTGNKTDPKANRSGETKEGSRPEVSHGRLLASREDSVVAVSQDKLAELFDTGSAFTLPPITELFEHVVSLFSRKQAR